MNNIKTDNTPAGKPAKTPADRIFNLAITVLAVLFVILIFGFFHKLRGYSGLDYTNGADSILRSLNQSNYYYAANNTWRNRALDVKNKDGEFDIPYALSDYYLAAFYETAHRAAGDTAKADTFAEKKAEYRKAAGDLAMIADDIDEVLAPFKRGE